MKKGIGILFMLTLVVVLASLAVFFVEDITTPIIDERQRQEIQAAVEEVFPAITGTTWDVVDSTKDFSGSPITGAKEIMDGTTLVGMVYTVEFRGFSSLITYVVGVDRNGTITGYKTISQNDTAGYGAQIADAANWEQFVGLLLAAAGEGSFDGLTGASVTTAAWKQSFADVASWHSKAGVFPDIPQIDIDTALIKSVLGDDTLTVSELSSAALTALAASSIDTAYEATNGTDTYVIYIEEYASYAPGTKVFLAVDKTTHETVAFQVLANNDTSDWGGKILESARWAQLENESLNFLINGDFDDLGGATTTYSTWQNAMYRIAAFHQEQYQGIITYSLDVLIPKYQEQLSPVQLGGLTTWTITSEAGIDLTTGNDGSGFTLTYDSVGANSQSITVSQDGFNFAADTAYRITMVAYSPDNKGIKVTLGDTVSQKITLAKQSDEVADNTYRMNFTPTTDLTDLTLTIGLGKAVSGESGGETTIVEVRVEEMGQYSPDQATNQVVNSNLETIRVEEVTDQKLANVNISNIFDIVNDLGEVEGTIYYGYTLGAYDNGPTIMNFMLGIDADGNYTGFRFLSTTDSLVNPSEIYTADYNKFSEPGYFAESIEGQAITSTINIANVAGLELQINSIEDAINEIGRYHDEDYSKRFNETVSDSELALAFDGAVRFEEIYNDYDFVQGIVNVYEAYNASDALIGYVYAGKFTGMSSSTEVKYTIGVNLDGDTELINIYDDAESWQVSGYGGSEGSIFNESTWLANFEGLDVSAFVTGYTPDATNPNVGESDLVDAVSGVSTTTGGDNVHSGLVDSVYKVLKFHIDNSVGGAL